MIKKHFILRLLSEKLTLLLALVTVHVSAICATAFADSLDVSGKLEFVANPNMTHWSSTNQNLCVSRLCMTLFPYQGKIYLSGGDWNANSGPCPIFAIDPKNGKVTNEYAAGTESVWHFRPGSDGRLYVPGVDLKENSRNKGAYFRRDVDGTWTNMMNCAKGNISELGWEGYFMHIWDLVCWKGKVFTAGYGISYGDERTDKMFTDATPCLTNCVIAFNLRKKLDDGTEKLIQRKAFRRFEAFLSFPDELFCYPLAYMPSDRNENSCPIEEWRFDEDAGIFICQTNVWKNLFPDNGPCEFFGRGRQASIPQCVIPFKGKCAYLVAAEGLKQRPRALAAATNVNHTVRAILARGIPTNTVPVNLTVSDDKIFALCIRKLDNGSFENSVWASEDADVFTELFTFRFKDGLPAGAFCKADGMWFFSVGLHFAESYGPRPQYAGQDGAVYRINKH